MQAGGLRHQQHTEKNPYECATASPILALNEITDSKIYDNFFQKPMTCKKRNIVKGKNCNVSIKCKN